LQLTSADDGDDAFTAAVPSFELLQYIVVLGFQLTAKTKTF